jgi:hypothetical protein
MASEGKLYRAKVSFSCLVRGTDEPDAVRNIGYAIRTLTWLDDGTVRNINIQTNGEYHKPPETTPLVQKPADSETLEGQATPEIPDIQH